MITKLSRKNCLQLYPKLPWSIPYREMYVFPKVYKQYVLTLPSKTAKGHAKNIGIALQMLVTAMRYEKLIFLGDTTTPWLYRQNSYRPAQEAADYLTRHTIGKTFNGGLLVDTTRLPEFTKHLFWLVRSNIVLPVVYAMDEEQHIVINLCQYGNLHICTLDKKTDSAFNKALPITGLQFLDAVTCYEIFGKGGNIAGRKVLIG